ATTFPRFGTAGYCSVRSPRSFIIVAGGWLYRENRLAGRLARGGPHAQYAAGRVGGHADLELRARQDDVIDGGHAIEGDGGHVDEMRAADHHLRAGRAARWPDAGNGRLGARDTADG